MNAAAHFDRAERLRDIAAAVPGVTICVVDLGGRVVCQLPESSPVATRRAFEVAMPGALRAVVRVPETCDASDELVLRAALETLARCEELEEELRSMDTGSAQLMEQISMLHETLPNLCAKESTEEVARAAVPGRQC